MAKAYQRILLKLSGEALMGNLGYGIDPAVVQEIAQEVADVVASGTQVAIVVGGGNIFRGVKASSAGMDRANADYIGMIATVMNAMTLQDALEQIGVATRVQTADRHAGGGRTLYPSPSDATFGKRTSGGLWCGFWEPVFLRQILPLPCGPLRLMRKSSSKPRR